MRAKPQRTGVLLGLLLLSVTAVAGAGSALLPVIPPGKGERCVEPTDVMRRDHMNFLVHQRDDTVYGGIRGAKHSLIGCIDCHVQTDAEGAAVPINAEGQFCQSCHGFAGVRMDCFGCHATLPAAEPSRSAPAAWMEPPGVNVVTTSSEE